MSDRLHIKAKSVVAPNAAWIERLRQMDVVFVIDTTGSMDAAIHEVAYRMGEIVAALRAAPAQPNVFFGVVAYRDYEDEKLTYLVKAEPLTGKVPLVERMLKGLKADGGFDFEEAVYDGLYYAISRTYWREASTRLILLVGDAPPHPEALNRVTLAEVIKGAYAKNVIVHTIGVGSHAEMVRTFREIAHNCRGRYLQLLDTPQLIAHLLELLNQAAHKMRDDVNVMSGNIDGMSDTQVDDAQARLKEKLGKGKTAEGQAALNAMEQLLDTARKNKPRVNLHSPRDVEPPTSKTMGKDQSRKSDK